MLCIWKVPFTRPWHGVRDDSRTDSKSHFSAKRLPGLGDEAALRKEDHAAVFVSFVVAELPRRASYHLLIWCLLRLGEHDGAAPECYG